MEHLPESTILLIMAGIIVLAIFYLSIAVSLTPYLRRLISFIIAKIYEYQALDRGDTLTLLRDAGLSQEQSLWFYDTFYARAASWERCLIKLYVKHCIKKVQ